MAYVFLGATVQTLVLAHFNYVTTGSLIAFLTFPHLTDWDDCIAGIVLPVVAPSDTVSTTV